MLLSGHTRRRELIAGLGSAAAWLVVAPAQQPGIPVIGFLDTSSLEATKEIVASFRTGLRDAGYVEDKNVAIEFRWSNDQRVLAEMAAELVRRKVNVIFASGASGSILAAKTATSTIPIVFEGGVDPVKYGLVASLSRPGGNITGVTAIHNQLAGKRLDLLLEFVPRVTTIAYLVGNQGEPEREYTHDLLAAADRLERRIIVLECHSTADLEAAFSTMVERQADGLIVSAFPAAFNNRNKILALAANHKIPTIYAQSQYAHGGGLMSYCASGTTRQAAAQFVARILKGAKPADLPVRRPTQFKFIINLKTTKALGLAIPPMLLAVADEVIE
jgi:putative tryptophan/tyrosine transport system substrate-binding protein